MDLSKEAFRGFVLGHACITITHRALNGVGVMLPLQSDSNILAL